MRNKNKKHKRSVLWNIFTFSELVVFMVLISEVRSFQIDARRNKIPFFS